MIEGCCTEKALYACMGLEYKMLILDFACNLQNSFMIVYATQLFVYQTGQKPVILRSCCRLAPLKMYGGIQWNMELY